MVAPLAITAEFRKSIVESVDYPKNQDVRTPGIYPANLYEYRKRLQIASDDHFDNLDFDVKFRDLQTGLGEPTDMKIFKSAEKLDGFLGIESTINANNGMNSPAVSVTVQKKDPLSRFIYFSSVHNQSRLRTDRESLARVLTYHQVMPAYLDFILTFSDKDDVRDRVFSRFCHQISLSNPQPRAIMPELGRTGKQFQMCYTLKGASWVEDESRWAFRSAAIHHQFDVESGGSLWIVTKPGEDLWNKYVYNTAEFGRPEDRSFGSHPECFRSSLSSHLLYARWAAQDWHRYLLWTETEIKETSALAIDGPIDEQSAHKIYDAEDIQSLQYRQDVVNMVVTVLHGNVKNLQALKRFYSKIMDLKDFPDEIRSACHEDMKLFNLHLDELIDSFETNAARSKLLTAVIRDRRDLVQYLLQTQSAKRMEAMNRHMEAEAVRMGIITLVTLIFLPGTFIASFFSTDVIKYQNNGEPNDGIWAPAAWHAWKIAWLSLTGGTIFVSLLLYIGARYFSFHGRWRQLTRSTSILASFKRRKESKDSSHGALAGSVV